jgi:large subunit ribosomal protein L14
MIQQQSILQVADNSGAKTVRCIKVPGGFKKTIAKLGDTVIVSVQNLRNKAKHTSKVKKKEIYKGLIIRTKSYYNQTTGLNFKFNQNAVVLINKQGNPVGSRVIGPIPKTLPINTIQKIGSMSTTFI